MIKQHMWLYILELQYSDIKASSSINYDFLFIVATDIISATYCMHVNVTLYGKKKYVLSYNWDMPLHNLSKSFSN